MKAITTSAAVSLLLAGCTTTQEIKRPDGAVEYLIACGASLGWNICYEKANQVCPNGYNTLSEIAGFNRKELRISCPAAKNGNPLYSSGGILVLTSHSSRRRFAARLNSGVIRNRRINMRLLVLISILLATGCASGVQKMRKIDPGMSFSQVDEVMGRRDSFKSTESDGSTYTLYQYTNQFCNVHVSIYEKCDFFVIFRDGEVVETGVKDVRDQKPNMQFIHLFRY